jgi:hypothetical protein
MRLIPAWDVYADSEEPEGVYGDVRTPFTLLFFPFQSHTTPAILTFFPLTPTQKLKRSVVVECVESHPTMPFCTPPFLPYLSFFSFFRLTLLFCFFFLADLSGGLDSQLYLWQFGHPSPMYLYRTANDNARITRVRFDPYGYKFGASDSKGEVHLFRFEAKVGSQKPYQVCFLRAGHFCGRAGEGFFAGTLTLAWFRVGENKNRVCCVIPRSRTISHS